MIQATIAVYPLQQADYEAVHRAINALRSAEVSLDVQSCTRKLLAMKKLSFRHYRQLTRQQQH